MAHHCGTTTPLFPSCLLSVVANDTQGRMQLTIFQLADDSDRTGYRVAAGEWSALSPAVSLSS
jgi:hypothetical protein